MLGILSTSFIGERIFHSIKNKHKHAFSIEEYLVYQDIKANGTREEKNLLTFKMLDLCDDGQITLESY